MRWKGLKLTKKITLSKKQLKKLVSFAGFDNVNSLMGDKKVITLRQRLGGHLKLTEEYKCQVLKALEYLGIFQDIIYSVKLAKKELKEFEEINPIQEDHNA